MVAPWYTGVMCVPVKGPQNKHVHCFFTNRQFLFIHHTLTGKKSTSGMGDINYNPKKKKNVFRDILESACLSVDVFVCVKKKKQKN